MKPKGLVVFYSRTGTTRKVAEALAKVLDCDLEELRDTRTRAGLPGYLRSGADASFGRLTVLEEPEKEPADYDFVIVGSPVWRLSVSTPVRTYLTLYRGWMRRMAFFVTESGIGGRRALDQMASLCCRKPLAELILTRHQVERGRHLPDVERFSQELLDRLAERLRPSAEAEQEAAPPPQ